MKLLKSLFYSLIIASTLLSCSEYNKVMKSEDYAKKFELANSYFDAGKYAQAMALYEQVYQRFPKQSEGELAYFRLGKGYYLSNDYYMGGYFLGQFVSRFPFSTKVEEATFLSALCSVKQSPSKSLDQTDTEIAINNLQQFVDRFPESELVDSCNRIMDRLQLKIETKSYDAVKLYSKTMNYRAAVTSSEIFLSNYPTSKYKEECEYILVNNSYLLAKNSVDSKKIERIVQTIERYRTFVADFPSSKYIKSLNSIKDEMEKQLIKLENLEAEK
ncbi:MAG: outer membrane protein assembly factor BamD [Crocinitomicaceae bacterium]|nr:outer membrane protein assembly factor BamD [Crocinitomicaceae bacterium]